MSQKTLHFQNQKNQITIDQKAIITTKGGTKTTKGITDKTTLKNGSF